jgi:putative Mg2+ transporter-C (MgtC) family protein
MPPIFDPAFRNDALNLIIAVLLGGAIGFERQWRQRLAGLRTNTGLARRRDFRRVREPIHRYESDAGRRAGRHRHRLSWRRGDLEGRRQRARLNTAATLWCSCAVGLLAGAGHWSRAILAAGLVAGVNLVLRPLVRLVNRQPLKPPKSKRPIS